MAAASHGDSPPAAVEQSVKSARWKRLIILPCVVVIVAVLAGYYLYDSSEFMSTDASNDVDFDVFMSDLFVQYDSNGDGVLSPGEFHAAATYLLAFKPVDSSSTGGQVPTDSDFQDVEAIFNLTEDIHSMVFPESGLNVTLRASMIPLETKTMSKAKEHVAFYQEDVFAMFRQWTSPNIVSVDFPVSVFETFLPKSRGSNPAIGESYYLIGKRASRHEGRLHHGRFWPPHPQSETEHTITKLLGMFHPRPFVVPRFGPKGTLACVRAHNKDFIDIVFRIHAEFQLNELPLHPFWFTPAQFAGNIVMRKDGSDVKQFNLYLSTEKKLNVDMEWITSIRSNFSHDDDKYNMEVDIGFMPELALRSDNDTADNAITWEEEISAGEARSILEKEFYPFKTVDYVSFNETFALANDSNKLVHVILLWGSLDDQSC